MKGQMVKKSNALVNASYRLSTVEKRLILMAIVQAKGKASKTGELEINAEDYAKQFNVELPAAYHALKDATDELFDRSFSYEYVNSHGNIAEVKSRWIQERTYVNGEGIVKLSFAQKVLPLIHELEKAFTYYELNQISNLKSQYAIRLYEMMMSWRTKKEMPTISLTDFKKRLGIEHKYTRMRDFKIRVLDLAIEQINEHTDIIASYEQHKKGRVVSGFTFSFKFKKTSTNNSFNEGRKIITKAQAEQKAFAGESWKDLYKRLSKDYVIQD